MSTLYLVATPIGNLEDMSPRAVHILQQVVLIAAEDTRHTGKLLKHFSIATPLSSYFEHNKLSKIEAVLEALSTGDVALVSDAGTPGLNDPGYELVRAALEAGYTVSPIPGPSAPVAALVASGLPTDSFLYLGYLPHKATARRARLRQVENLPYTLIWLESPYRIVEALGDMLSVLGDRRIAVARELTKLFEEIWRGTLGGALEYFSSQPVRGEFTLVVAGATAVEHERWSEAELETAVRRERQSGKPAKQIASELAEQSGWSRRQVYNFINRQKAP
jgi:16S rRNA (cytidine1402-2'-O)-methyltransferase